MGSKWTWLWFVLMCVAITVAWFEHDRANNDTCTTIMSNLDALTEKSKSIIVDFIED